MLSAAELSGLRGRAATDAAWPSLLKITVGGRSEPGSDRANEALPAVAGRYAVADSAITFTPLFPFDPGRAYRVVFDPSQLPRPRQAAAVTAVVATPFLMYGSRASLVEDLLERRARLGISYIALPGRAMRAFAPVVAELRGK